MRASTGRLRFPLPPELRKRFKSEIRPHAATKAQKIGAARRLRESRIADAKAVCRVEISRAELEFDRKREQALASFEAKAAERAVAADLAVA